jgi:hypothetical protein
MTNQIHLIFSFWLKKGISSSESDDNESPPVLTTQTVEGGLFYDFTLSVDWHPETGKRNLQIRTVKTVQEHRERSLRMPLWALFWLREQMASMLVEHDGSERIDEMPTLPEWEIKGLQYLYFF